MNIIKKQKLRIILGNIFQYLKFGIVGVSNTVISLSVYYFLIYFNINYIIANTMGFIISVLNAYFWNNKYVFNKNCIKSVRTSLIKVFVAYGITFILNTGMLYIMVNCFDISRYIAPIVNVLITMPINFLLNKYWVFK